MSKEKEPKGPACKKIANPCKICLQSVSTRTGIQCQGACEAWVHFECLDFTPGKVKDVKGGVITITCPCPDCKSSVPKEYRTVPPFTCNNVMCPANNPPACEEFDCQANEASRKNPPRCPPPGTLRTCGERVCCNFSGAKAFPAPATVQIQNTPACTQMSDGCFQQKMPLQQGPLAPDIVQQMCKTVGDLAQQLNSLMDSLKALGGAVGPGGAAGPGGIGPRGPIGMGRPGLPGILAGQGMKGCGSSGSSCGGKGGCNKCNSRGGGGRVGVGMGGGGGVLKKPGCTGGCGQAGQTGCAQPCHCPGNPAQKHR